IQTIAQTCATNTHHIEKTLDCVNNNNNHKKNNNNTELPNRMALLSCLSIPFHSPLLVFRHAISIERTNTHCSSMPLFCSLQIPFCCFFVVFDDPWYMQS